MVAKTLFQEVIRKNHPEFKPNNGISEPEYIKKLDDYEESGNLSINMALKECHNQPDLVIWDTKEQTCNIVEFSCPVILTSLTRKKKNCQFIYH